MQYVRHYVKSKIFMVMIMSYGCDCELRIGLFCTSYYIVLPLDSRFWCVCEGSVFLGNELVAVSKFLIHVHLLALPPLPQTEHGLEEPTRSVRITQKDQKKYSRSEGFFSCLESAIIVL